MLSPSRANTEDSSGKLIEYFAQEKTNLTIANNEIKLLPAPSNQAILAVRKQQNAALLALTRAKIANLESFLVNQKKQQQKLAYYLKKMQQSTLDKSQEMIAQEQISKNLTLNEVNDKTIELITTNLELAYRYEKELVKERGALNLWQAKFNEKHKLKQLITRISLLQEARDNLYQKNINLQQEKRADLDFNTTFTYEARLLFNNQIIILIQHRITELELQKTLIKADYLYLKNHDIKTIQAITGIYKNGIEQLSNIEQSLKKMVSLLTTEQSLLIDNALKHQFLNLQKTAASRLQDIRIQQQTLEEDLGNYQEQLKNQLSMRQSLTEYHSESWPLILNQLVSIPAYFYGYLKMLSVKVKDNYVWQDFWPATFYWVGIGFIFAIGITLNYLLRKVTQDKERSRLTAQLYDGVLLLFYRNVIHLTGLTLIVATFFLNHVALANYQLLLNLLLVWLTFRNLILIARLVLLERISDVSGKDVQLYYRLKWLFLMGGWSTALMVFSHQLPLSILLQDIFNRLFMLFLLAVSLVLWKSKDVMPYLLRPFLKTKKRYFRNAITAFVILVPLTVFTTAIIGLSGFINLAWTLSEYQAYFLLVIISYLFVRGLAFDALELLSEWMISALRNGWLWIEVILKPLDKIIHLLLMILSLIILFQLFDWHADSWVMTSLIKVGQYPFVNLSGVRISLISTLEFFILLSVIIWAATWTREFCYRWVYRNAKDAGIRNSLSVFTQYAVILIGGFITLRVLGIDFTGMAMVLGGLAVGMGFGLRDFASNIIGGIMLLIERPVREGDLITLGEYEGRVAHIGIRSMRVSSWDNMEVLIPNAETFNKPFTNWTHQDSVIRTVIPIKVSRADDPIMIQQLILDVLAIIPEILNDPPAQVLLKQIDDALIDFEVRYFINVQLYTRFEIRSKVLFAITAQFNAAGVRPPIPPINIELSESNYHHVVNKRAPEE